MSFIKEAASGFIWNQGSELLRFVLAFLFSIVLARCLHASGYGIYATIISICTLAILFGSLGLNQAVNNYVPKLKSERGKLAYLLRRVLLARVIILLIICLAIYFFSIQIAGMMNNPGLSSYLSLAIFYVFFFSISNLMMYTFIGFLKVKLVAFVKVTVGVLNLVLAYFLLTSGYGINSIIGILILTSVLSSSIYLIYLKPHIFQKSQPFDTNQVFRFSRSLWLINFVDFALGTQIDIILMGYFLINMTEIGFYNVAVGLVVAIGTLPTVGLGGVALSAFSELHKKGGMKGLAKAWSLNIKLTTLLIVPFMIFGTYYAGPLIPLFYSEEYMPAVLLFQVMAFFFLTSRLLGGGAHTTVFYAANKEKIALYLRSAAGILNLILDIILIPIYGAMGAIIATGSSIVVIIVLEFAFARSMVQGKYPLVFSAKIVGASLLALVGVVFIPGDGIFHLITVGVAYGLLWVGIIYALKPLEKEDVQLVAEINDFLHKILKRFAK